MLELDISSSFWWAIAFISGAFIGSFVNVVSLRMPDLLKYQWDQDVAEYLDKSPSELGLPTTRPARFTHGRSRCPHCKKILKWWQLIPLISFVTLIAKCFYCKEKISWRYPIVEFTTGCIFVLIAKLNPPNMHCLALWLLASGLICLALIDLDTMLLPDDITLPLMWLGLLYNGISGAISLHNALWGAMAGYVSLWLVYQLFLQLTGKEGMGFGDFKLLAAMGAWLGWQSLLPIVLASSIGGSLIGIILIIFKRHHRNQPIPFGPWLVLGGLLQITNLNLLGQQWLTLPTILL